MTGFGYRSAAVAGLAVTVFFDDMLATATQWLQNARREGAFAPSEFAVETAFRPKDRFRALRARRGGYDAIMFDVQLQVIATGALVWAQSFSDEQQADAFYEQLSDDLEHLSLDAFRSRYSVPSTT